MRFFILAVTGLIRHRFGHMSLIAGSIAVIISCSALGLTDPTIESVVVTLTVDRPVVGQTVSATATLRDLDGLRIDGQPVTWTLSNPAVAALASDGNSAQISTLAAGTTQITATSGGRSGAAPLTIDPAPISTVPVASTSVDLAATSLNPGQITQATATTRDANNDILPGRAV